MASRQMAAGPASTTEVLDIMTIHFFGRLRAQSVEDGDGFEDGLRMTVVTPYMADLSVAGSRTSPTTTWTESVLGWAARPRVAHQ